MNLPPPDDTAHHDVQLLHDLAIMNTHVSRYIFHFLDADAGRAGPITVTEERELAGLLKALADRLQARANQRASSNNPPMIVDDTKEDSSST